MWTKPKIMKTISANKCLLMCLFVGKGQDKKTCFYKLIKSWMVWIIWRGGLVLENRCLQGYMINIEFLEQEEKLPPYFSFECIEGSFYPCRTPVQSASINEILQSRIACCNLVLSQMHWSTHSIIPVSMIRDCEVA